MLQKVSTDVVRSYAGELRVPDDQRESQVLFEYDSLFKVLLETGINFSLELPALFSKSFIDHGCVTGNLLSYLIICLFIISLVCGRI